MKKLKKQIKTKLIKIADPFIKKMGYTKNEEKDRLLGQFFNNLKSVGFEPLHIVDIGANRGTWTRKTMQFFPNAYYTMIEPQENLSHYFLDILANTKVALHSVGAGSMSEILNFTIADRDDSSSFVYDESEVLEKGLVQKRVEVKTLNEILLGNNWPIPDIIKIDAEGMDIEVLKGADRYHGKTEIFLVEAAVFEKSFKNSFQNVVQFMDEIGYKLFEITDLNRPFQPKFLWLVELAFIKKGGKIDSYSISQP